MELLLKTFSFTEEEFYLHNKNSTLDVQNYYKQYTDTHMDYLEELNHNLLEYCQFGADKCHISNFKEFCDVLDIDIVDNLSYIIREYYNIFKNKNEILYIPDSFYRRLNKVNYYHFYNRDKTFMFTCTSPLFMDGSLGYFGCTGDKKYVIKAFEVIYNNENYDLCYGSRDYV
jgi:hypothetical protein